MNCRGLAVGLSLAAASQAQATTPVLPRQAQRQLLDRVVAVVDRDVITQSQMMMEIRVALAWRAGPTAAAAELAPPSRRLQAPVLSRTQRAMAALYLELEAHVINQHLIAGQVRRQGSEEVNDEDLTRRLAEFRNRFDSSAAYHAFLHTFGVQGVTLRDILRRDLHNERFIESRLKALLPASQRTHDGAAATADQQAARLDRALQDWLAQLKQHVEIRLIGAGGELEVQQRL